MNRKCERCREYFSESEMDIYDGKWLCNDCEEKLRDEEDNSFGGVF
jgi:formylmethanofuran dehydrogenase subunit E